MGDTNAILLPLEDWLDNLDARQQQEVQLAVMYTRQYGHGTSGHLSYLVIAKLYELLEHYKKEHAHDATSPGPTDGAE